MPVVLPKVHAATVPRRNRSAHRRHGSVSRSTHGAGQGGCHTPGGFTMRAVRQPSSTPSSRWTAGSKRSGQA